MSKEKFTQVPLKIQNMETFNGGTSKRIKTAYNDTYMSVITDGPYHLIARFHSGDFISEEEQAANVSLFLSARDMYRDLNSLILSITSHPDYISGCEDDEWHTLVRLAQSTLEKAN